jgi:predicted translin family RNA/ssDNA-binding protein
MSSTSLVSAEDFAQIIKAMQEEDDTRETLIKRSRDVLKLSKNATYALHRGDSEGALGMLARAKAAAQADLLPLLTAHPQLRFGALSSALEEYAEAVVFTEFVANNRIPTLAELEIVTKVSQPGTVVARI